MMKGNQSDKVPRPHPPHGAWSGTLTISAGEPKVSLTSAWSERCKTNEPARRPITEVPPHILLHKSAATGLLLLQVSKNMKCAGVG